MPPLHTVYNELNTPINHYWPSKYLIIACLIFILIVSLTYILLKIQGRNKAAKKKEEYQINSVLIIFFEIVLFVIFLQVGKRPKFYHRIEYLYDSGQVKIVEGYVVDYNPMSKDDHGDESFKVNGVEFHYSFYEEGRVGYHLSANHGGVIRPNLFVRIVYWKDGDRNAITKLETE